MRSGRLLVLAAVLLAAATGCASTRASSSAGAGAAPTGGDSFQVRAAKLAAAWDGSALGKAWGSGYVPLQETSHDAADAFHSGADKAAYIAGQFRLSVPAPSGPAQQTVRFDDGATRTLPALSADQALRTESIGHCAIASCPATLTVTGVRATTERVLTSQGWATVPAWAFRLQGYQGEFVDAAVRPEKHLGLAPGQEPTAPPVLPGYQGASLVSVSTDGRTLTLGTTTGCGMLPPTGLVREVGDVVVVGATDRQAPSTSGAMCAGSLELVDVQVQLAGPLAGRTVLDVASDQPTTPAG